MSNMKNVIEESFTQYAGAVLQSRALVDVRDCLKPSARQIFYCLYTDKFLPTKPFKKTLKAIGSIARMYIHGDSSAEGVIMRAGQPFAMRYPLIEVEGNAGNLMMSGNWAATRYTASRLSEYSIKLFDDIDKDTIDEWRDNYDDTEKYPTVLPSKGYYNIVNGTMGIGIGAASSIPQFNLREVNQALETLLLNPECNFEDIYCAPDFATGAYILNEEEVKESLKVGTGASCRLRAVVDFDAKERALIVTEIPYSVYTNTICGELEAILQSEDNPGIERFNDLTGTTPLIKIYLTKRANPDKVIKYLYKYTSLQSYYGINMTMLEDGRFPRVFSWKEALQAHIDHEKEVYTNAFNYDLTKMRARIHVLDGLIKCCAEIEEVVHTIKTSNNPLQSLQERFLLDEVQAKAVLDMKLARIAHLEVEKLIRERKALIQACQHISDILASETLFNEQLIEGWRRTAEKFGDDRRTKILNISTAEETIEEKSIQLSVTNKGNIYATEVSTLYSQRRGGVGMKLKLDTKEIVIDTISARNTDTILLFTNKNKYYHFNAKELPFDERISMYSLFNIGDNEIPAAIIALNKSAENKNIMFFTKNGYIKKSLMAEYNITRNTAAKAMILDDNDEIVDILFCNEEQVGMLTEMGNFLRVETKDIRPLGRLSKGIKGIKLNDGDALISAKIIKSSAKEIVSVSGDGYIKRTLISEFNVQTKNTKGAKIQKLVDGDYMADFLPINDLNDITVNASASCIKFPVKEISLLLKGAQGTKAIKLSVNNSVISLS